MGLTKIIHIKQRLGNTPLIISRSIEHAVKELSPVIEDMNTAQLQLGKRSDGSSLPNYSPVSVAVYGKPAGPIKLFDQGDFYKGITTKVGTTSFSLVGEDSKTEMLSLRYGDNIIGLSDEHIKELSHDYIKSYLLTTIRRYIQNGIE